MRRAFVCLILGLLCTSTPSKATPGRLVIVGEQARGSGDQDSLRFEFQCGVLGGANKLTRAFVTLQPNRNSWIADESTFVIEVTVVGLELPTCSIEFERDERGLFIADLPAQLLHALRNGPHESVTMLMNVPGMEGKPLVIIDGLELTVIYKPDAPEGF